MSSSRRRGLAHTVLLGCDAIALPLSLSSRDIEGIMFLQEARLGGVQGSADLRWRRRSLSNRDWRGTFVFEPEDEPAIADLVDAHRSTTYEALIDGQPKKLAVKVTAFSPIGVAFFEGSGEPY